MASSENDKAGAGAASSSTTTTTPPPNNGPYAPTYPSAYNSNTTYYAQPVYAPAPGYGRAYTGEQLEAEHRNRNRQIFWIVYCVIYWCLVFPIVATIIVFVVVYYTAKDQSDSNRRRYNSY